MATYKDAVYWIAANDDTEWLDDENPSISVTAALVADLFKKTDEQVTEDIRRKRTQIRKEKKNDLNPLPSEPLQERSETASRWCDRALPYLWQPPAQCSGLGLACRG